MDRTLHSSKPLARSAVEGDRGPAIPTPDSEVPADELKIVPLTLWLVGILFTLEIGILLIPDMHLSAFGASNRPV